MFLDKLIISAGTKKIREVIFKKGLNLVVDETTKSKTDSGNNIGKTTFLRIIDFCLGGKKADIYTDKEFHKRNEKIYKFLTSNNIQFELTLKTKAGSTHQIIRPIEGVSSIDGVEKASNDSFEEAILAILFQTSGRRPTLAQLMNKFVRIEEYQISNALYFMHMGADQSEYEALFMFLFGFRDTVLLGRKRQLVEKIKKLKAKLQGSFHSIEDLEQQLFLIQRDIGEVESSKKSLNFSGQVRVELGQLKELQIVISDLKLSISKLTLKSELTKESLSHLQGSKATVNVDAIEKLYNQAKVDISALRVRFEDVVKFHNQMIDNKIKYLTKILRGLESELEEKRLFLNSKLGEEAKIISRMSDKGALDEYDKISIKLQEMNRERGIKEGLIQSLQVLNADLSKAREELDEINNNIEGFESALSENLKSFNIHFSEFSNKLYGDKYYLTLKHSNNEITDNILLDIGNMNENIGTGKKAAQISALDLAFLKFSEDSPYTFPLFVLHDQLETIFENQIETLFVVSNSLKGQFVVPILSDKLHNISKDQIDENCVLRLSQTDKLFRIP